MDVGKGGRGLGGGGDLMEQVKKSLGGKVRKEEVESVDTSFVVDQAGVVRVSDPDKQLVQIFGLDDESNDELGSIGGPKMTPRRPAKGPAGLSPGNFGYSKKGNMNVPKVHACRNIFIEDDEKDPISEKRMPGCARSKMQNVYKDLNHTYDVKKSDQKKTKITERDSTSYFYALVNGVYQRVDLELLNMKHLCDAIVEKFQTILPDYPDPKVLFKELHLKFPGFILLRILFSPEGDILLTTGSFMQQILLSPSGPSPPSKHTRKISEDKPLPHPYLPTHAPPNTQNVKSLINDDSKSRITKSTIETMFKFLDFLTLIYTDRAMKRVSTSYQELSKGCEDVHNAWSRTFKAMLEKDPKRAKIFNDKINRSMLPRVYCGMKEEEGDVFLRTWKGIDMVDKRISEVNKHMAHAVCRTEIKYRV